MSETFFISLVVFGALCFFMEIGCYPVLSSITPFKKEADPKAAWAANINL